MTRSLIYEIFSLSHSVSDSSQSLNFYHFSSFFLIFHKINFLAFIITLFCFLPSALPTPNFALLYFYIFLSFLALHIAQLIESLASQLLVLTLHFFLLFASLIGEKIAVIETRDESIKGISS